MAPRSFVRRTGARNFRNVRQAGRIPQSPRGTRGSGHIMAEIVRLRGARVALDASRTEGIDLAIADGRILPFDSRASADTEIDVTGHLLLPGLINAHDHLEYNLFPRLG